MKKAKSATELNNGLYTRQVAPSRYMQPCNTSRRGVLFYKKIKILTIFKRKLFYIS